MFKFKDEKDMALFSFLHPALIMIYADMYLYAKEKYQVELVITDTISTPQQDRLLGRVSSAHQEGRALDIRSNYKNLNVFQLNEIINYTNNKWAYKKYHYMSNSGVTRLAYLHTHKGEHIHLAIHKKFSNPIIQQQVADLIR
jgi:hypothetical protein